MGVGGWGLWERVVAVVTVEVTVMVLVIIMVVIIRDLMQRQR